MRPHPAAWLRQPASCLGGRRRPARVHGNRVLVGDTPPSATGNQAAGFRLSDAPALRVQCMLNRGTLGRSDSVFAGPPAWLRDGGIVIAPATVTNFNTWYQVNGAITVAGEDLTEWAKWAAANDELPGGVCGTSISARALQRHVFGKDPAAGDPWGA